KGGGGPEEKTGKTTSPRFGRLTIRWFWLRSLCSARDGPSHAVCLSAASARQPPPGARNARVCQERTGEHHGLLQDHSGRGNRGEEGASVGAHRRDARGVGAGRPGDARGTRGHGAAVVAPGGSGRRADAAAAYRRRARAAPTRGDRLAQPIARRGARAAAGA
ncbi:hypothetical protein T484DRAFT_2027015, partial [Baffinella frigidus]